MVFKNWGIKQILLQILNFWKYQLILYILCKSFYLLYKNLYFENRKQEVHPHEA